MPTVWSFTWGTAQSITWPITNLFHKTRIPASVSWNLLKRKLEYYRKEEGRENNGNILRAAFSKILGINSSRNYPFISKHVWNVFTDFWKDIVKETGQILQLLLFIFTDINNLEKLPISAFSSRTLVHTWSRKMHLSDKTNLI